MGTLGQSLGRPGILIVPINSLFPKKGPESVPHLSRGFAPFDAKNRQLFKIPDIAQTALLPEQTFMLEDDEAIRHAGEVIADGTLQPVPGNQRLHKFAHRLRVLLVIVEQFPK